MKLEIWQTIKCTRLNGDIFYCDVIDILVLDDKSIQYSLGILNWDNKWQYSWILDYELDYWGIEILDSNNK